MENQSIVTEKICTCGGVILLRPMADDIAEMLRKTALSEREKEFFSALPSDKRRAEWLTRQFILKEHLGGEACADYNESGAPRLSGDNGYISVSHSSKLVALYHSTAPCGIDVEEVSRDFSKAASRIASPQEMSLRGNIDENTFLCAAWCAKEALYKYAGIRGLDFIKDMRITSIDEEKLQINLLLKEERKIVARYTLKHNHLIVWV